MDQYLNNRQNEILWKLLAEPAEAGTIYNYNLQRLVEDFPQSGIFKAMLAHTDPGNAQYLKSAAISFNPALLHKLINHPDTLAAVKKEQIVQEYDNPAQSVFHEAAAATPVDTGYDQVNPDHEQTIEVEDELKAEPEQELFIPEFGSDEINAEDKQVTTPPDAPEEAAKEQHPAEAPVAEDVQTPEEVLPPEFVEETKQDDATEQPVATAEPVELTTEAEETLSEVEEEPEVTEPLPEETTEESEEIPVTDSASEAETEAKAETPEPVAIETVQPAEIKSSPAFQDIDDEVFDEILGIEHITVQNPNVSRPAEAVMPSVAEETQPAPVAEETETPIMDAAGQPPAEPAKQADQPVAEETAVAVTPEEQPLVAETPPVAETPEGQPVVAETATATTEDVSSKSNESPKETDDLILGSAISSDFFVFESVAENRQPETVEPKQTKDTAPVAAIQHHEPLKAAEAEKSDVSKYNDEKLPYSFMWWLDKTRKEHAATYQPYAGNNPVIQKSPDRLQQLYYENIFHVSAIDSSNKNTVEFDENRKEDRIIERFIQEEPHITTPSNEKLDNENKAKKSSEDQNELVTETLARIYTDQMLYHKAIIAYKKLMLKFPEKSSYFADQIEQLEKKTN